MKALILDTHAFLWLAADSPEASEACRAAYLDPAHTCLLSMASVWEMAIKLSLGRLELGRSLRHLMEVATKEEGIVLLDVALEHALHVSTLAMHHRDPFDRMIASQALVDGWPVVSKDSAFDAYGVTRIW